MNLYPVAQQYRDMMNNIDELTDEQLLEQLESVEQNLVIRVSQSASIIDEMEVSISALKQHEKDVAEKRKKLEERRDRIKTAILEFMERTGKKIIESPVLKVSVRENPISVEIVDESKIPGQYLKIKEIVTPDKNKIKDDYKATGMEIEGTRIIRTKSLVIK